MNLFEIEDRLIGFRPENFLPPDVLESRNGLQTFPFRVSRVENLGSDRLLYGTLAGINDENRAISKLPSTVTAPIELGQTYGFVVQEENIKQFDKNTGLRIMPER
jgi:multiple sugar transport system ATP-binding protein